MILLTVTILDAYVVIHRTQMYTLGGGIRGEDI